MGVRNYEARQDRRPLQPSRRRLSLAESIDAAAGPDGYLDSWLELIAGPGQVGFDDLRGHHLGGLIGGPADKRRDGQ
jgi:hypothetical protein